MQSKLTISNNDSPSMDLDQMKSMRYEPTALVAARLLARTMILVAVIIGSVMIMSSYIQSRSYERCQSYYEPLPEASEQSAANENIPVSIRMNGRAADLINLAHGQKGKVSCSIERKIANQLIASEPKELNTPFGNLTTDPRLIQLTGEKLHFSCNSGDKHEEMQEDDEMNKPPTTSIKRLIIIARPTMDNIPPEPKQNQTMINRTKRQAESLTRDKECSCSCSCDKNH